MYMSNISSWWLRQFYQPYKKAFKLMSFPFSCMAFRFLRVTNTDVLHLHVAQWARPLSWIVLEAYECPKYQH